MNVKSLGKGHYGSTGRAVRQNFSIIGGDITRGCQICQHFRWHDSIDRRKCFRTAKDVMNWQFRISDTIIFSFSSQPDLKVESGSNPQASCIPILLRLTDVSNPAYCANIRYNAIPQTTPRGDIFLSISLASRLDHRCDLVDDVPSIQDNGAIASEISQIDEHALDKFVVQKPEGHHIIRIGYSWCKANVMAKLSRRRCTSFEDLDSQGVFDVGGLNVESSRHWDRPTMRELSVRQRSAVP